jgi:hypothetical protein
VPERVARTSVACREADAKAMAFLAVVAAVAYAGSRD